jgi:hypothetical protein
MEVAGRRRGLDVVNADDLVLALAGLRRVRGEFLRRRLVDLLALPICLRAFGRHRELCAFALRISRQAPGGFTRRLNLARNALRKIGIFELVHRCPDRVVLVDNEGILQAAHNLFVHVGAEPNLEAVREFVRLAPLPDAVVYVRESDAVLIQRTLARGHRRVRPGSDQEAGLFVRRAVGVFEELSRIEAVARRMVRVDGGRLVSLADEAAANADAQAVASLAREGVAVFGEGLTAADVGTLGRTADGSRAR